MYQYRLKNKLGYKKFVACRAVTKHQLGIHMETHRLMGGIYEAAAEMGSGAMIHLSSIINIGTDIQQLVRGGTRTQEGNRKGLLQGNELKT
jgi:hypothetical protein